MAPLVLTAEEKDAAMLKGSSELQFLFASKQVSSDVQAQFYHSGICTTENFASIVENHGELKLLLKDDFGVDPATDLATRVMVSNVLVSWDASKSRVSKLTELEGEYQARRMQKPLAVSEYNSMRLAWEKKFWKLDDSHMPGKSYMEARADALESGDLRAEQLTAVLSRDEDQSDTFQSFWDSAGQLQLRKGGTVVAEPPNPEALRRRLKLVGMSIMLLGLRHTNRPTLQGYTPQTTEDYLGYLLGEFVWQLTGRAADGSTVLSPAWSQLLVYDFNIRKKAFFLMNDIGTPFVTALSEAWHCPVVKERYFTTPVALSSTMKRPFAFNDDPNLPKAQKTTKGKGGGGQGRGKGSGKSGGKGKKGGKQGGKGSGKGGQDKALCFAYNNDWERCRRQNCPFQHICSRCSGKHPVYQCSNSEAPASETQGKGV